MTDQAILREGLVTLNREDQGPDGIINREAIRVPADSPIAVLFQAPDLFRVELKYSDGWIRTYSI